MKKLCMFFMTVILCFSIAGCYDGIEIDDQAYVIAMGLDKGKSNFLRMTLQIALPAAIGGGSREGSGGDSKTYTVTSVETPTIYTGFNMVNTYISKKLNLSHVKVLIISADLAREGIRKYMYAIYRGREFRNIMHVAISRGSAQDYLKKLEYVIDISPAKYYELAFRAYEYTGFSARSQFFNFYGQMSCTCEQAVATLVGVNTIESLDDFDPQVSTVGQKGRTNFFGGDFKAGDMPKDYKNKAGLMGLAVFDGSKMVGELDGEETIMYLMLKGDFKYCSKTIPDPHIKDHFIILNIRQSRHPIYRVKMINDKPDIYVKANLEADILSIQSGVNYESVEKIAELETHAETFLKNEMSKLLEKTAKEFKSDIFGFGKDVKMRFLTWDKWEDFKWLQKYEDARFNVDVDLKIRRPGLIIRTVPFEGTQEGETGK